MNGGVRFPRRIPTSSKIASSALRRSSTLTILGYSTSLIFLPSGDSKTSRRNSGESCSSYSRMIAVEKVSPSFQLSQLSIGRVATGRTLLNHALSFSVLINDLQLTQVRHPFQGQCQPLLVLWRSTTMHTRLRYSTYFVPSLYPKYAWRCHHDWYWRYHPCRTASWLYHPSGVKPTYFGSHSYTITGIQIQIQWLGRREVHS